MSNPNARAKQSNNLVININKNCPGGAFNYCKKSDWSGDEVF